MEGHGGGSAPWEDDEGGVGGYAEHFVGGGFFVADLGECDAFEVVCCDNLDQSARGALVAEEDGFGGVVVGVEPSVETFVGYPLDVVRNGGLDGVDNILGGSSAIVIFYCWFSGLLGGFDDLEGWKALDAHAAAESLVALIVTIDGGDLSQAIETLGGFFVGGFEVLAMAAPWGVESFQCEIYGSK